MFCRHCGVAAQTGSSFCGECGAPLLAPDVTSNRRPTSPMIVAADVALADRPTTADGATSRKQQLHQLKRELKGLKLELREVNAQISQVRTSYQQGAPLMPYGLGRRIYRETENIKLLQPQQRRQSLQQQIFRVEEQILALENSED